MTTFEGIKLGIIQGLAEFLPISSSGHMAILSKTPPSSFTEVFLHAATLLAILLVLFKEVFPIFLSPLQIFPFKETFDDKSKSKWQTIMENKNIRTLFLLFIATLPAILVGLFLKDRIETLLANRLLIGISFAITGIILFLTRFIAKKESREMTLKDSIIIGLAQAFAILPGISRSGSTISAALFRGIDRNKAGIFSFMLSIPIIIGATILEFYKLIKSDSASFIPHFHIPGFIAALITGYFALTLLLKLVKNGKLHHFAYYCFFIAILTLSGIL